ncbi:uncharacterized protein LOC103489621 [Cucumis melo]|uniref:Uncharacterized protein LOC103489621 n=1 Tax=Cucumis melo TaxID=3656 RepID=A0ABM3KK93_CUCME|nr:uncharacterized protein LOC103489621 [Cucumis melo]
MLKYLLRDKSANSIRGNTYPQVPPCHRGPTSPFPKDSLRFAPQAFSLAVEIFLYLLHCISLIGYRTSNVHWQTYHGDCNYFFTQALILSSQISILLLSTTIDRQRMEDHANYYQTSSIYSFLIMVFIFCDIFSQKTCIGSKGRKLFSWMLPPMQWSYECYLLMDMMFLY